MNELKPCPFCGGAATMIRHAGLSVSVRCMSDECKIPSVGINYCEEAEAITAWNTRAAPTMKAWEWVAIELLYGTSATYTCNGFTIVNDDCHGWLAWMNGKDGTRFDLDNKNGHDYWHDSEADAKATCVAYVEGKLKEWVV